MVQYDGAIVEDSIPGTVRFRLWEDRTAEGLGAQEPVGTLQIEFDPGADDEFTVTGVWLTTQDKLTPTDLKRFAWDRWIKAAETIIKTPKPEIFLTGGDLRESRHRYLQEWAKYSTSVQAAVGRPGMRGHGAEHYQRVASLYQSLFADGESSPIKRMANDLGVSRNTVSGWVARARKDGYLPKGRQGKAG